MNVASLVICRELYELSGWGKSLGDWTHLYYCNKAGRKNANTYYISHAKKLVSRDISRVLPAYDLGYLLRKLQNDKHLIVEWVTDVKKWQAGFSAPIFQTPLAVVADTPENAAGQLAIELFKQGILMKAGDA